MFKIFSQSSHQLCVTFIHCTVNELYSGSNHLFVFINPLKAEASSDLPDDITWEFAQKEIAQAKGFVTAGASGLSVGE